MNKIVAVTIYLLWFAAVFDPIGKLYALRFVALSLGLACLLMSHPVRQVLRHINTYRSLMVMYISLLMPLYGLCVYAIRGDRSADFIDTSYLSGGLLFLLLLIYSNEVLVRTGLRAMVVSLRLLVVLIGAIWFFSVFQVDETWLGFLTKYDMARIGSREYAGTEFLYLYFLASPMLIFLIGYELNRLKINFTIKNIAICFVVIFAFILTGTRSHVIIGLIYAPFFWVAAYARYKFLVMSALGLVAALVVYIFFIDSISAMFSVSETSNAMKVDMLANYIDIFYDPFTLLFGQGYNAHTWSSEFNVLLNVDGASKTELTYLELVRVYGVFISSFFYLLIVGLLFRLTKLSGEFKWLSPALFLYLLNSSLNPYLFSTNGMLPLGLIVSILYFEENRRINITGTKFRV